jgi:sarcosine oxidase subunit delta
MLKISCPWCGERSEEEFRFGGPAHLERPAQDESVSDEAWASYLFMRDNIKGISLERWCHTHGCGQWFNMARDTLSHKIYITYKMGEQLAENWQQGVGHGTDHGGDDE